MSAVLHSLDPSILTLQRHIARVRELNAARPTQRPTLRLVTSALAPSEPRFGEEEDTSPPRRKPMTTRLQRVQARAAVFQSPDTLCSSQDIADIFGIRESEARALRPGSARPIGRALMAPFADWHRALLGPAEVVPRTPTRRSQTLRLEPLGGPGRK